MFRENAVKGENSLDGDYFLAEVRGDFVNNVKPYEDNNRFLEGFENDPSIQSYMAKHLQFFHFEQCLIHKKMECLPESKRTILDLFFFEF